MADSTINDVLTNTFEIGTSFADIGGEDIDLKSLNLTDTLLGTAMTELTQALGEAENNAYESYHLGDSGISDIELTMFDSALLRDSGIKVYTEDPNADDANDDDELGDLLKKPEAKKEKSSVELLNAVIAQIAMEDAQYEALLNDDKMAWCSGFQGIYDENGEYVGNENDTETLEFTDADFDDSESYLDELDAIAEATSANPMPFYNMVDEIHKINPFYK